MLKPPDPDEERITRLLWRAVSTLKLVLIVTVYFALCITIIMAIIGARA